MVGRDAGRDSRKLATQLLETTAPEIVRPQHRYNLSRHGPQRCLASLEILDIMRQ
jgi:hypothetical protein